MDSSSRGVQGLQRSLSSSPSTFRRNLFANLAGTSWSALLGILLVPVYLRLMGVAAYGLVGLYVTLQALVQVFDLGLTPTMNREMARYSMDLERIGERRSLARTLEIGYWGLGTLMGAAIIALAPIISREWLNATEMPTRVVADSLALMGLSAFLQWPVSLYIGGLMGLQKQVLLNWAKMLIASVGAAGAGFVLVRISPSPVAFFAWQALMAGIQVVVVRTLLWRSLPPTGTRCSFSIVLLKRVWHFAAGLSGITLAGLLLTQIDKVVLSRVVALSQFGYYSMAGVVSGGITLMLVNPVFNTFFPRFSAQVASGLQDALRETYHFGSQVMTVLVVPTAVVVAMYSFDIIRIWSGSEVTARAVSPVLTLMAIGTALNGLMYVPYALQLAHGWTGLALRLSVVFLVLALPAIVVMTLKHGLVGAASVWPIQNAVYVLVGIPLTHRRLLKGEAGKWLAGDVGVPLASAMLAVVSIRLLWPGPLPGIAAAARIGIALVVSMGACALAASMIRRYVAAELGGALSRIREKRNHGGEC